MESEWTLSVGQLNEYVRKLMRTSYDRTFTVI